MDADSGASEPFCLAGRGFGLNDFVLDMYPDPVLAGLVVASGDFFL